MQICAYPLPLYLNQKYVFDLLAMMEDGIAHVETVKVSKREQGEVTSGREGQLGLTNAFGLLGITFSGKRLDVAATSNDTEHTREKVHTPNSLFSRVYRQLDASGLILRGDYAQMAAGAFVETQVVLQRSPLLSSLNTMKSIMKVMSGVERSRLSSTKHGSNKGQMPSGQLGNAEMAAISEAVEVIATELTSGTLDLFGRELPSGRINVLLTVDQQYLSDPSLADLVDGEFRVLGKITRILRSESEAVNLLRNTILSGATSDFMDKIRMAFSMMGQSGMTFPDIVSEMAGPAIQIMPLAIYA